MKKRYKKGERQIVNGKYFVTLYRFMGGEGVDLNVDLNVDVERGKEGIGGEI